ncbi:MAG: GspM family type II secretion system protein XcpZ [Gammaproteobacteria bacterium]|nr:MAG: GspM family type II secretion system protein XcpZ [Gammaproteobacteria bacterium]
MIEQWLGRWHGLQVRERIMIVFTAVLLGSFIFYIALWRPLQSELTRLQRATPAAQNRLALMRVQAKQIKKLKTRGPNNTSGGNMLTHLEQAANSRGLRQNISKMEPDGQGGVRLTLEAVSFNNLISLLSDLHKKYGLRVDNANIDMASEEGMVNARLHLQGAGK